MRTKKEILNVDFIGEQTPLTKEEQKTISDFFKLRKKPEADPKVKVVKA